ncbi:DUF423 domain-containing protein [Saprospiraceae bacterium]|nr:DUF423 domain-containing protein [Saprospiraceae bacterium]MDA9866481.1 DUF423 domain-containing protein [Saprospiraceae bacterium]
MRNKKRMLTTLAITGMLAISIGAFGAHGLKPKLTATQLNTFNTGVNYHFYHLLAMSFSYLLYLYSNNNWVRIGFWSFLVGIVMFSGSLYLLSIRELIDLTNYKWLGPLTPIGGVCFIFGWLSIMISAYASQNISD